MERTYGIGIILGVCGTDPAHWNFEENAEILLNFVARTVVCLICMYFLNSFFTSRGFDVAIGINPLSLLTCGTLGISGLAALYGILVPSVVVIMHKVRKNDRKMA